MCIFYFSKKIASWVMLSDPDAAGPLCFLPVPVLAAVTTVAFLAPGVALCHISDGASLPPTPGLAPSQTVQQPAWEEENLSTPPGF